MLECHRMCNCIQKNGLQKRHHPVGSFIERCFCWSTQHQEEAHFKQTLSAACQFTHQPSNVMLCHIQVGIIQPPLLEHAHHRCLILRVKMECDLSNFVEHQEWCEPSAGGNFARKSNDDYPAHILIIDAQRVTFLNNTCRSEQVGQPEKIRWRYRAALRTTRRVGAKLANTLPAGGRSKDLARCTIQGGARWKRIRHFRQRGGMRVSWRRLFEVWEMAHCCQVGAAEWMRERSLRRQKTLVHTCKFFPHDPARPQSELRQLLLDHLGTDK